MAKTNKALDNLANMENLAKGHVNISDTPIIHNEDAQVIDGYKILPNEKIAFGGRMYPASWRFAYRCPESIEVANFSTINEKDKPAILAAVEEMIRKCFVIIDSDTEQKITNYQINDGDKTQFFLLLRDFYLPGKPINYNTMCLSCKDPLDVNLNAFSLRYPEYPDELFNCFDGRRFTLDMGLEAPIVFHVPTFEITGKIFRYIMKVYKENQEEKDTRKDSEAFNKQFLLVAPFLFETGMETIPAIKQKFNNIIKNPAMLKVYVDLANQMKFDNLDTIITVHSCGSEEETLIKFPGGWKNMFIDKNSYGGLFG